MGVLVLALYAEGPSDAHFLPAIIQRTAKNIIDQYRQDIDVSEPIVISIKKQKKRNEIVRRANSNRSHRRQKIDFNRRYELLARNIDLSVLALVPSYKAFRDNLTRTLAKLHFIPFNMSEDVL